jgi:hypothetical protein
MDNYKVFTWTARFAAGPSFDISFIALTSDEARVGLFKQFEEIKQARQMDAGEIPPIYFKPRIHTDFLSEQDSAGLLNFTEDMKIDVEHTDDDDNVCTESDTLGNYIKHNSPTSRPLNLASIIINSF